MVIINIFARSLVPNPMVCSNYSITCSICCSLIPTRNLGASYIASLSLCLVPWCIPFSLDQFISHVIWTSTNGLVDNSVRPRSESWMGLIYIYLHVDEEFSGYQCCWLDGSEVHQILLFELWFYIYYNWFQRIIYRTLIFCFCSWSISS